MKKTVKISEDEYNHKFNRMSGGRLRTLTSQTKDRNEIKRMMVGVDHVCSVSLLLLRSVPLTFTSFFFSPRKWKWSSKMFRKCEIYEGDVKIKVDAHQSSTFKLNHIYQTSGSTFLSLETRYIKSSQKKGQIKKTQTKCSTVGTRVIRGQTQSHIFQYINFRTSCR